MREDISGIQYFYQIKTGKKLEFLDDNSVCHICGGPLTVHHTKDNCSAKWTDEAVCEGKESEDFCEACNWARAVENLEKGKPGGYGNAWKLPEDSEDSKYILAVTAKGVFHPHLDVFLNMIQDESLYPAIFAISQDKNRTRKHTTLFISKSISYCPEDCHIWYNGLRLAKETPYTGVATVDAVRFATDVEKIAGFINAYVDPYFEPSKDSSSPELSRRTNALSVIAQMRWLNEERRVPYTENEYLRDYLACVLAAQQYCRKAE